MDSVLHKNKMKKMFIYVFKRRIILILKLTKSKKLISKVAY